MSDIPAMLEEYKQRFSSYGTIIAEKFDKLKTQAVELLPKVTESVQANVKKLQATLLDLTPVGDNTTLLTLLLEHYFWVAICLFFCAIGFFVGHSLIAPLLGLIFNTGIAFYLAVLVVPLTVFVTCARTDMSKEDRATIVLVSSFGSSMLIGYVLSARFLSFTPPPMFLFPLMLGVGSVFLGPTLGTRERPQFVGALLGVASFVALMFGMITGNLGGQYIIWILLLVIFALLDFQLQVGRVTDGSQGLASNQTCSLALYQLAGILIMLLLSSSSPPSS